MRRVVSMLLLMGALFGLLNYFPRLEAAVEPNPPRGTPDSATRIQVLDTLSMQRDSLMEVVLKSIAGRETQPAESVFRNIKSLRGVPAGRVPRMMNMGFSKNLGVGCAHCHVIGEWHREDKTQKQVTREMMALVNAINSEYLPKIKNLKSEKPTVNCTTCHRGNVKPALNLPERMPPAQR